MVHEGTGEILRAKKGPLPVIYIFGSGICPLLAESDHWISTTIKNGRIVYGKK
jgi:hypothetical protein